MSSQRESASDRSAGARTESDHLAESDRPAGGQGEAVEVLRAVWAARGQTAAEIEDQLGPQKSCKTMQHVGFDGLAGADGDLRSAWRATLERDGKLSRATGSVRDLVLGRPDTQAE